MQCHTRTNKRTNVQYIQHHTHAIPPKHTQHTTGCVWTWGMMFIKEIENKGYQVTYTLDYDNKREKPFMCRLRITNPSYQDAGSAFISSFEDNLKKLGFNQASLETEDNLKKLFSNLMKI